MYSPKPTGRPCGGLGQRSRALAALALAPSIRAAKAVPTAWPAWRVSQSWLGDFRRAIGPDICRWILGGDHWGPSAPPPHCERVRSTAPPPFQVVHPCRPAIQFQRRLVQSSCWDAPNDVGLRRALSLTRLTPPQQDRLPSRGRRPSACSPASSTGLRMWHPRQPAAVAT
jgi:hypothetical protein